MKTYLCVAVIGLSLVTGMANAKEHHDKGKGKGSLPPGLQKKVDNGGSLPPGWHKKYRQGDILDYDIYRRGRVIDTHGHDGVISIEVDNRIIRLIKNTREIVSILGH
ncbi:MULTISPECIES: hypothetical protein [unclassified Pseudoalteromonas]|uniref:hypothetical protein n=1 Tax=unclassified Pseudoalteromonas TaxID=194690 RepID=UPI000CF74F5D|nr:MULTISPECIES: hypothetical protein [unclassified Pseudoalteromonas]